MDYEIGDLIDGRFTVEDICNDSGGMGQVLFVEDLTGEFTEKLVLKYCKKNQKEYIKRFRREVRLLEGFAGNSKVVNTVFSNTRHEPPYFVMKYYKDGDLTTIIDNLEDKPKKQEKVFTKMIDCISELHSADVYHRDIKPQNFLLDGKKILVSDFGLGMEPESSSRFTSSSMFWGTQGYLPPEFQNGGFKYADETADIYMLGKSFYLLLTKQNPAYLMENFVHPALFHVIERACELEKNKRYQNLSELKQALQLAYDVILGRGGHLGEVNQLKSTINDKLENEGKYKSSQVKDFINNLALVDSGDQLRICLELKRPFFSILTNEKFASDIKNLLKVYRYMVESGQYGWAFAETIADNMKILFNSPTVSKKIRSQALELAIEAAGLMNRFAAMDTCVSMITSVTDDKFGAHIGTVIQKNAHTFVSDIELAQCKCDSIRNVLRAIQAQE